MQKNEHKRKLGRSDIAVSPLGLGCWPIGGLFYIQDTPDGYGEVDDQESKRAIRAALERGVTLFDTADVYGAGHSERVLGEALKGVRHKACIATKFGYGFNEATRTITGECYSPGYMERALDASLSRLGTDYIDLYQLHVGSVPLDAVEPIFSTLEKMADAGKIRAYGWSSDLPEAVKLLSAYPRAVAVQYECNVVKHNPSLIGLTGEASLTGLCRSPLGMGLLSGKYKEETSSGFSPWDVRSQSYEWCAYFRNGRPDETLLKKLAAVREILTSQDRSLVQGALAWLWGRAPHHVPLPGFRNEKQAVENAGAMEKGPLTPQQIEEIERLFREDGDDLL